MWEKFCKWARSFFEEQYVLTVWFHSETTVSGDGMKTISRSRRVYYLTSISKKTPTHIIGKDEHGFPFEIRTVEPFDYTIRKTQ